MCGLAKWRIEAQPRAMDKELDLNKQHKRLIKLLESAVFVGELPVSTARDPLTDLARVVAALERIEAGRFGFCNGCSGPIALERLDEDPATPWCGDCADIYAGGA